jgi:hypothetical protein
MIIITKHEYIVCIVWAFVSHLVFSPFLFWLKTVRKEKTFGRLIRSKDSCWIMSTALPSLKSSVLSDLQERWKIFTYNIVYLVRPQFADDGLTYTVLFQKIATCCTRNIPTGCTRRYLMTAPGRCLLTVPSGGQVTFKK